MADVTDETTPDVATLQAQIATLTEQLATANASLEAAKKGGGDAEVRRLKSELRTAKAELATAATERDAAKARVTELEGTVTETTTKALLKEHGIDPDDLDYVLNRFGKVEADEDGHKPDLGEFLTEAKAGKAGWYTKIAASAPAAPSAAPAPAPKSPPAPAVATTPAPTPPAAEPSAPPAPAPTSPDAAAARTTVTTKAGGGPLTPEQIRALSPAEYKAHRAAIRASIGAPVPN